MRLQVLFLTNIPSPYVVGYLNELQKYCEVTALFELMTADDREKSWYGHSSGWLFHGINLHAIRTDADQGLSFRVIRYLGNAQFDRIIIANPSTPTGITALLYCRHHHVPFILQSEGGFRGNGKSIKEHLKKYLMENADLYLTGMGGEDDYFLAYGASKDRLRPYPFTSLHQDWILKAPVNQQQRDYLRRKLGIREQKIVLYVGQFIERKRLDILLEAMRSMPDDYGLYLIGGKELPEYSAITDGDSYPFHNLHYIDFCTPAKLCQYYQAADVFVLPTREDTWGLVINEAMANGLPVITTDRCIAGRYLVENGANGYILPVGDAGSLTDRIALICEDTELRDHMSAESIRKIQPYSLENMAITVYESISE